MNTTPTTGDHDPIAEDMPETVDLTWREIELATYEFGTLGSYTLIEYIAATNDAGDVADHRWQTQRENHRYPESSYDKFIDPTDHTDALAALESANLYLNQAERKPLASLLIIIGTLYSQAALTLLNHEHRKRR